MGITIHVLHKSDISSTEKRKWSMFKGTNDFKISEGILAIYNTETERTLHIFAPGEWFEIGVVSNEDGEGSSDER